MHETVIKVENLSKMYRLGVIGTGTLSHDLNRWWHKVQGREDPYLKIGESNVRESQGASDYVWALRDINFEVKQGEVLGIIGKNGAGKSTLLKLLSKVTGPTEGRILAKGRIASLLEVGTGFHPELTGRENIYLNGTILGMNRSEVTRKLEEIVTFAGVARYVDTPVKRYSSGMKVRLGFAVAAHLEPEILIVDEVLAVGDAEFQKKAIGKMQEVSQEGGRTVLFVSHNMVSVRSLCPKAMLFVDGMIAQVGESEEVINSYLSQGKVIKNLHIFEGEGKLPNEGLKVLSIGIRPMDGNFESTISMDSAIEIITELRLERHTNDTYDVTLQFKNDEGRILFGTGSSSGTTQKENTKLESGLNVFKCLIPSPFLNEGEFSINLLIVKNGQQVVFRTDTILIFHIGPMGKRLGTWMGKSRGWLNPTFEWEILGTSKIR